MLADIEDLNPAKIRWQCRRGMLELDIMLLSYFDTHYLQLATVEQRAFAALLKEPDQTLHGLLSGQSMSCDPKFSGMVQKIREHLCKMPNSI